MALMVVAGYGATAHRAIAYSGNELFADCENTKFPNPSHAFWACVGLVNGLSQGYEQGYRGAQVTARLAELGTDDKSEASQARKAWLDARTKQETYCIPHEVTRGQVVDVVRKYLEERPAERHHEAIILVVKAMNLNFPCRQKETP